MRRRSPATVEQVRLATTRFAHEGPPGGALTPAGRKATDLFAAVRRPGTLQLACPALLPSVSRSVQYRRRRRLHGRARALTPGGDFDQEVVPMLVECRIHAAIPTLTEGAPHSRAPGTPLVRRCTTSGLN